jgi:LacI family transcriptional regulator
MRPETRQRILELAALYHYQPPSPSSTAVRTHTNLIGCVMTSIQGSPDSFYLAAISAAAFAQAHHLAILETLGQLTHTLKAIQVLADIGVKGIVIHSGHFDPIPPEALLGLQSQGIVLVATDVTPTAIPVDHVGLDETALGEMVVRYLMDLGHRHIALIAHLGHGTVAGRPLAIKQALQRHKIPLAQYLNWDAEAFGESLTALLTQPQRPTALIVTGDNMAAFVMQVTRGLGLHIPRDISIIGCGNGEEYAAFLMPPLTTLTINYTDIGQRAAALLFQRLAEGHPPDRQTIQQSNVQPTLIKRASCGPPPR